MKEQMLRRSEYYKIKVTTLDQIDRCWYIFIVLYIPDQTVHVARSRYATTLQLYKYKHCGGGHKNICISVQAPSVGLNPNNTFLLMYTIELVILYFAAIPAEAGTGRDFE